MNNRTMSPDLLPVLLQLQAEGYQVYTYKTQSNPNEEIDSLYWYENGRVLNIQPNIWRRKYATDRFNLSVSYIPSQSNGSGCGLIDNNDLGTQAEEILNYRHVPTWVRGAVNYSSMAQFLKRNNGVLKFYRLQPSKNPVQSLTESLQSMQRT